MTLIYISIFTLLNFSIYYVVKHYKNLKFQLLFILFLIIVIKYLCNIYEKEVTLLSLFQLSKFSISIPIFILFFNLLKDKAKTKNKKNLTYLNYIRNENTNFSLIITTIILIYQVLMLLTGMFKTLS